MHLRNLVEHMFRHKMGPFACVRMGAQGAAGQWRKAARLCRRLTPLIEWHPTQHALMLALGGSERLLLGGDSPAADAPEEVWPLLGEALAQRLAERSVVGPAIGLGPTRTLAWLASEMSAQADDVDQAGRAAVVVLPGEERSWLAPLPVALLREIPDAAPGVGLTETTPPAEIVSLAEIVAALEEGGIRTLGQAQRLAADTLARRFGPAGAGFAALAAGDDLRPLYPRIAAPWMGARLAFEPPVAAEQLTVALGPLAEKLALTLARRELAAGKIALALESETGKQMQAARRLAHPLGTTRALLDAAERLLVGLLAPVPDMPDMPAAPDVELPAAGERYITLRLRVGGLRQATAEQRRLWAAEQQRAGAERIERLAAALWAFQASKHADALLRAEAHAPDAVLPEERYRLAPRSP